MATTTVAGALDATLQLAANAARFGWYYGVNQIAGREASRLGLRPSYRPRRPVPGEAELRAALWQLMVEDARAVREGLYPPMDADGIGFVEHVRRLRAMFEDLPATLSRRASEEAHSVREVPGADAVPDYYAQDFHYQTGGYLSEKSARLYDVQVDTLFYGAANAMRRAALRPVAEALKGRDQRAARLADIACGTGRFLRQARLAFPALRLTGIDLSRAYLEEAARHLGELRPATLIAANAEALPLAAESQDIVTSIFLYHELPPDVRRRVTVEIARVLRPGGTFVLVDSLQMGDRPGWDGLLEAFPVRFHEPYYRSYVTDDLDGMLRSAGLAGVSSSLAFMSKVTVCHKPG